MIDQNIMFGYTPPMEKNRKIEKCQSINFYECPFFYIGLFLLK